MRLDSIDVQQQPDPRPSMFSIFYYICISLSTSTFKSSVAVHRKLHTGVTLRRQFRLEHEHSVSLSCKTCFFDSQLLIRVSLDQWAVSILDWSAHLKVFLIENHYMHLFVHKNRFFILADSFLSWCVRSSAVTKCIQTLWWFGCFVVFCYNESINLHDATFVNEHTCFVFIWAWPIMTLINNFITQFYPCVIIKANDSHRPTSRTQAHDMFCCLSF